MGNKGNRYLEATEEEKSFLMPLVRKCG